MNRGGGVHTVYNRKRRSWLNRFEGEVVTSHRLRRQAVSYGRALAKLIEVEHSIHRRKDGRIAIKNSYGNDPNPPKDGG